MGVWETAVVRAERLTAGRKLNYTGRVRTQGRETERIVRAVMNGACRPDAVLVSTYWWEKVKNFGDLLTPYLLRDHGIVPVLTPPAEADLVGVGSLIHHLPADSTATLSWAVGTAVLTFSVATFGFSAMICVLVSECSPGLPVR